MYSSCQALPGGGGSAYAFEHAATAAIDATTRHPCQRMGRNVPIRPRFHAGSWLVCAAVFELAVTGYQLSLWLHITAVVVGLGATFAESIAFPVAIGMDARYLPFLHRLQRRINQWLASPALLIILITGMYQVSDADLSFGDAWISATFAIVIVLGGILGAYFIPTDRVLEKMVSDEIAAAGDGEVTLSDEYQRAARTEGIVGAVAGVLVVIAIYLMVVKPGA